nr:MAG TPA: hypothetical protein [Caudoviricetes sp.]
MSKIVYNIHFIHYGGYFTKLYKKEKPHFWDYFSFSTLVIILS